jgi:hypothetical protein
MSQKKTGCHFFFHAPFFCPARVQEAAKCGYAMQGQQRGAQERRKGGGTRERGTGRRKQVKVLMMVMAAVSLLKPPCRGPRSTELNLNPPQEAVVLRGNLAESKLRHNECELVSVVLDKEDGGNLE